MQLTGKSIKEKGIITNIGPDSVQQQGVDVRLDRIYKVCGLGVVPMKGKTFLPDKIEVFPTDVSGVISSDNEAFELEPGYYEVDLMEGCNIPPNAAMYFKGRSSMVRCGVHVDSGQFDGGFQTAKMGCFLDVKIPIVIERYARIAQAIVSETEVVASKDLYNGQFQNDKQRH